MTNSGSPPAHEGGTGDNARPIDRRTLDEIFGDVLPSVTQDEIGDGDERRGDQDPDAWYRENRPPHHG